MRKKVAPLINQEINCFIYKTIELIAPELHLRDECRCRCIQLEGEPVQSKKKIDLIIDQENNAEDKTILIELT